MSIKINYLKNTNNNSNNLVFFVKDKFQTNCLKFFFNKDKLKSIDNILKIKNIEKKILSFELDSKKTIILIKIEKEVASENLGADFYSFIKQDKLSNFNLFVDNVEYLSEDFINNFLYGLRLKSYEFNLYKSNKKNKFTSYLSFRSVVALSKALIFSLQKLHPLIFFNHSWRSII